MPRASLAALVLALAAVGTVAPSARADVQPDEHGQIAVLPAASGAHWLWVPDRILRHATLFDRIGSEVLGLPGATPADRRAAAREHAPAAILDLFEVRLPAMTAELAAGLAPDRAA